jgi:hypothetical protein
VAATDSEIEEIRAQLPPYHPYYGLVTRLLARIEVDRAVVAAAKAVYSLPHLGPSTGNQEHYWETLGKLHDALAAYQGGGTDAES